MEQGGGSPSQGAGQPRPGHGVTEGPGQQRAARPEGDRRRVHTLAKYEPSAAELSRTLNLARALAEQPRHTDREHDVAMAHLWRRHRNPRGR